MLVQLLSIFLSIADASDCAVGKSSQNESSKDSCHIEKDALEKHNNSSRSISSKSLDTHQSTISK